VYPRRGYDREGGTKLIELPRTPNPFPCGPQWNAFTFKLEAALKGCGSNQPCTGVAKDLHSLQGRQANLPISIDYHSAN
jgi:hypothetical protein